MYFLAHNGVDLKKFPLEDDYGVLWMRVWINLRLGRVINPSLIVIRVGQVKIGVMLASME